MGNNLPPGVSISDSDAPWNQDNPDPFDIDVLCRSCDWKGTLADTPMDGPLLCPDCGQGVEKA